MAARVFEREVELFRQHGGGLRMAEALRLVGTAERIFDDAGRSKVSPPVRLLGSRKVAPAVRQIVSPLVTSRRGPSVTQITVTLLLGVDRFVFDSPPEHALAHAVLLVRHFADAGPRALLDHDRP